MRLILIPLLFSIALAQQPVQIANPCIQFACFHASTSGSVAAAGTSTLTIQEPATGVRQVQFITVTSQCATQTFTVSQAQNGAAATTTAGTAVALIPTTATAAAKVFTASNVGAGTATAVALSYLAGTASSIDLSMRSMSIAANNYSVTLTNTGALACTGSIDIYWYERQ